jgi:hypothetical protein
LTALILKSGIRDGHRRLVSVPLILAIVGLLPNQMLIVIRHRVLFRERLAWAEPGAASERILAVNSKPQRSGFAPPTSTVP